MTTSNMPRKVGLYITTLIHDITQAGYGVSFAKDFNGMVRIDYTKEHVSDFYEHDHCGFPGARREQLEKAIIESLIWFKNEFSIEDSTEHGDDDVPPAA